MNDTHTTTVDIDARNLPELQERVAKANARANRQGLGEPFALRVTDRKSYFDDVRGMVHNATVDIDLPDVKLGDWTVVASVQLEDGGTVLRVREGHSLVDFDRPDAHNCQHCGVNRRRTRSFVLRDYATGETKQVGTSCLQLFTGVPVVGLWMLTAFDADELAEFAAHSGGSGGFRSQPAPLPMRWVIAAALEVTEDGAGYVSRAAATPDRSPTAEVVIGMAYFTPGRDREHNAYMEELLRRVDHRVDTDIMVDAVLSAIRNMAPTSDYAMNMAVLADSEHITTRSLGYAVSAVSVFNRQREQLAAAKLADTPATGYLGEVKDKLTGITARVTNRVPVETAYGISYLLLLRTDDNHVVKWFASNPGPVAVDDLVTIERATVKAHENYRGVDQTVVTRARLSERVPA